MCPGRLTIMPRRPPGGVEGGVTAVAIVVARQAVAADRMVSTPGQHLAQVTSRGCRLFSTAVTMQRAYI
jgi:hypothetical protein